MSAISDAKKHDLMSMQVMKQLLKSVELTETIHGLLDLRTSRSGRKPSVKKVVQKAKEQTKAEEQPKVKAETIEFPKPKSELERLADRLEILERKIAVNEFKQRKEVA